MRKKTDKVSGDENLAGKAGEIQSEIASVVEAAANMEVADIDEDAVIRAFTENVKTAVFPELRKNDPNVHYCWVSALGTNRDNVLTRRQAGWQLVEWDEVGLVSAINHSRNAAFSETYVTFGDTVLMKIPTRVYHKIMHHNHHVLPAQAVSGIVTNTAETAEVPNVYKNDPDVSRWLIEERKQSLRPSLFED